MPSDKNFTPLTLGDDIQNQTAGQIDQRDNIGLEDFGGDSNQNITGVQDGSSMQSSTNFSDPNAIKVTIADTTVPIIILFGPPTCGKTMTLIRLTRYLHSKGYTVEPDRGFRPSYDTMYKDLCDNFDNLVSQQNAAKGTSHIEFLLIKVMFGSKTICQILEAPGELYFNPKAPTQAFPQYLNAILSTPNRKIWMIMLEPDQSTGFEVDVRRQYVSRIQSLKKQLRPTDKVVFLVNKIDKTHFVKGPGIISHVDLHKDMEQKYPGIFTPFLNVNPITKLWHPRQYDFEAFHTGFFSQTSDGSVTYQEGDDIYPQKLWNLIRKRING